MGLWTENVKNRCCRPIQHERIVLKTAVLVWKCTHDVTAAYLRALCWPVEMSLIVLGCVGTQVYQIQ